MTKALPRAAIGPFHGHAWVCRGQSLPADGVIDLISDKPNRWSAQGEPTIYLSGDAALALVETGRHPDDLEQHVRLYEVDVRIPLTVDLRRADVRAALALPDDGRWVLDRDRARAVAQSLRRGGQCDALIVPSAGALDQEDRFNLVLFADDRARIRGMVASFREAGELVVRVAQPEPA